MVDIEYSCGYKEVLEILKFIPKEDYNKIPENKIKTFEKNSSHNYEFNYNPSKTLDEQNVSKFAKSIIAILFRDYWASDEQRKTIVDFQERKRREIRFNKFAENKIENVLSTNTRDKTMKKETEIMPITKISLWKRMINKIRELFHNH